MGPKRSSRSTPPRPHIDSTVGAFDQSLKYLLQRRPGDFIGFALGEPTVEVLRPSEAALPARGRDVDGGYLIRLRDRTFLSHTEFHRRHQERDDLALDVADAQVRLFRRERVPVLSHVWDLYGSPDRPVLEDRALELGAPLPASREAEQAPGPTSFGASSRCVFRVVNLRALGAGAFLSMAPPTLWPLSPLTRDGATDQAVLQTRDAIEGTPRLSPVERADGLAVLLFFAEAEGVAAAALREYISLEKLMDSEIYRSILEKGFEKGVEKGIEKGIEKGAEREKARTIVRILARKLGYLDEEIRVRVESETDIHVLEPWYDDALGIFDEASAQRLVDHIRRAPARGDRR